MTTLVSGFISNVNNRDDRNLEIYYNLGKKILKSENKKIIFVDELMYDLMKNDEYPNTIIIKYDKNESYLWKNKDKIEKFKLNTNNPNKDTLDYMLTMCNKTEIIRKAIEMNPFDTDNFVWLDFGINHVFHCSDKMFDNYLNKLNKKYDKIRIGHIWDLSYDYNINIYKNICWYFAGGIFGGNEDYLLYFADEMKSKCEYIINKYGTIMWEVNIWYKIYLENQELFEPYLCNHDYTIMDNY
jgi:hypothetical protein